MTIYDLLDKYKKKRKPFNQTEEFKFYLNRRFCLDKTQEFPFLFNNELSDFNVMRANIIIQGVLNKRFIEAEVKNLKNYMDMNPNKMNLSSFRSILKERLVDMPYLKFNDVRIYIPFFSIALNNIYINEPEKLLVYPYNELVNHFEGSSLDPFDLYGYSIFDSFYSRLILIEKKEKEAAFFHYDTNTIYFINKQGRLDDKLILFDKFIKRPNYNHMLERIRPVVSAYFNFNKQLMVEEMYKSGFISGKFISILHKKGENNEI